MQLPVLQAMVAHMRHSGDGHSLHWGGQVSLKLLGLKLLPVIKRQISRKTAGCPGVSCGEQEHVMEEEGKEPVTLSFSPVS